MTGEHEFRELIGEDLSREEEERLRRAHELLLAAGPMPDLPAGLERPRVERHRASERFEPFRILPRRRRGSALALAAVISLLAFTAGWVAASGNGDESGDFAAVQRVTLRGTSDRDAVALVQVGKTTSGGNVPMLVKATGLRPLPRGGYYTLALTKHGRPVVTCGTFRVRSVHGVTSVRMAVGYDVSRFDGWVVTEYRHGRKAEPVVLSS